MEIDPMDPDSDWISRMPVNQVSKVTVIREIYEGDYSQQSFAEELERALERGHPVIIIEPTALGDETARWITVGNFLHKSAVITGLGSIITCSIWPRSNPVVYTPLGGFSLLCTALYTVSWQFDNCVKYQVNSDYSDQRKKKRDVVLVRQETRENIRRRIHCSVSLFAAALCAYRLYRYLN